MTRREPVSLVLIALAVLLGSRLSPHFLDGRYLLDATSLYVEKGLLALGLTLVIVCGHIDLSVASTLALVACVTARMLEAGWPSGAAVVAGLTLGGLLGLLNGLLIVRFALPSFVVTLATMAAYRGAAQVLLGERSATVPANLVGSDMLTLPGTSIPLPLSIFLTMALLAGLVLHRTVFGRWVYAHGLNTRAALLSGVPTARVTVGVFVASGMLAATGAMLIGSRLGVARFDLARGLEVDAITAVVLGGASIAGGSGTILGTVLALALVGLVRIGMGVANVTAEYQLTAIGTLLIVSVVANNFVEKINWRARSKSA